MSFRESLQTRDGFGKDRYMSLDITEIEENKEKGKKNKQNHPNAMEFMNRTFMGNMTTRTPRIFGFKG